MSRLDAVAAGSSNPERVHTAFARLADAWPAHFPALESLLESFPAGPEALAELLAFSPVSAEKLIRDPGSLLWLSQPEICMSVRGPGRMERDLARESMPGFDPAFRPLRRIKSREMLRIALRDVARLSGLEQTMREISWVAELCLRTVSNAWLGEFSRRWGPPGAGFCVIGMGKLGGGELNYSSDIDVIYLYGEDGWLNPSFSRQEFFTRLAEKITATFSASSPDGALFRIDLRLRPEGDSGPLARSLESMENYYAGYGETWERMALIKARGVAGNEDLAYEFSHRLQPFVYPRSLSRDALDEIASIKRRIERELTGEDSLKRNVKLGRGGIREIEFIVQSLQLLHGARNAFLQERNTLAALRGLRRLELVNPREMGALADAYEFLRSVEHRLQIAQEIQTHTLPEAGPVRTALARSLGFEGEPEFDAALLAHTNAVREIFDKFLNAGMERNGHVREIGFFRNPDAAEKGFEDLGRPGSAGHVSPRTRKLYGKLEPLLIESLRELADPDRALHGFVRFVERYGIRGLLFESLVTNPRLLDLLLRLFDSSRFLTDIVLRRPQWIEEMARTGNLGRDLNAAAHLEGLARREEKALDAADWVRVYRRGGILRIALRDILGFADTAQVQREYTALAEACLIYMQRLLGLEENLTIIALGKFGGEELSYGCDLDVVFAGSDPALAASLIQAMTAQTQEGIVFPVDARLRPEGEAGVLAIPIESYASYFRTRAQPWEFQALTKARPISGPDQEVLMRLARETWEEFGRREDPLPGIRRMHARVVQERAGSDGPLAFKTGEGGLMDLEFTIQGLQMRHAIWEPNTLRALARLSENGILSSEEAKARAGDYLLLRRCEAVIRRLENSSVSMLPGDPEGQRQLAVRLGFKGSEEFLARYLTARKAIRAWCEAF